MFTKKRTNKLNPHTIKIFNKTLLVFVIGLVILLVFYILNARKNITTSFAKTEIIEYKQTYIPEERRTGSCWTTSIAANINKNAFRCNVEQEIFDPCFKEESGRVVCGVDPEQQGSGFELQLIKELPEHTDIIQTDSWLPWRLKLEDGQLCGLYTGTAAIKDGKSYYIYCEKDNEDNSVFGELDKTTNPWKIRLIHTKSENDDFFTETVDVIKVWK